jgi:Family of unknown function (DUF5681)
MSDKKVGYGNPPVHSRFQKGQSGNPGGRKKGCRNFKTILATVLESEIEDHGRRRRLSVVEALVWKQAECGLNGDWKASDKLMDRYERHFPDRPEPEPEGSEEDKQMLDDFLRRLLSRRSAGEDPAGAQ